MSASLEISAGHQSGCTCWACQRQRKALKEAEEAEKSADLAEELPSSRVEAAALYAMLGRNGDDADSLRALILVPPRIEAVLIAFGKTDGRMGRRIRKVLRWRQRVLEEFNRLVEFDAVLSDELTCRLPNGVRAELNLSLSRQLPQVSQPILQRAKPKRFLPKQPALRQRVLFQRGDLFLGFGNLPPDAL